MNDFTAYIETKVRNIRGGLYDTKEAAIGALQDAVGMLKPEDGRCRFVVTLFGSGKVVYEWQYQPTFRNAPVRKAVKKAEPKYICTLVYYVLLDGMELAYENLYHDAQSFDTIAGARAYMKEHGYGRYDYHIVYEYSVDGVKDEYTYGWGRGFTREEARENLNKDIGYYNLVYRNGRVVELK